MVTYDINLNPFNALKAWIQQQPNLISIADTSSDKIICEFNHDTTQEKTFKKEIAKRLYLIDNSSIVENVLTKIDELETDQLFFTTEFAVTKTNIGTTYVNVFTDFGGRPFFIDTTGFTKMAIQILWTKVGTGTQTMRIIEDATGTQIIESGSLVTGSNDFSDVAIPQGALNFKGKWRLQCKSTLAADDPIFTGFRLYLRR